MIRAWIRSVRRRLARARLNREAREHSTVKAMFSDVKPYPEILP